MATPDHPYQAPAATDLRSPCPALNTLANHGYLPRDGRAIAAEDIVLAFWQGLGTAPDITTGIVKLVKATLGPGPWTLEELADRKFVEHDTSLTREDPITGADQSKPSPAVVESLLALAKDSKVGVDEIAAFRKLRMDKSVENYEKEGKELLFSTQDLGASYGEAGFVLNIFGDKGQVSVDHARSFLLGEQFPADFKPHLPAVTQADLDPWAAKIRETSELLDPRAKAFSDAAAKKDAEAAATAKV